MEIELERSSSIPIPCVEMERMDLVCFELHSNLNFISKFKILLWNGNGAHIP